MWKNLDGWPESSLIEFCRFTVQFWNVDLSDGCVATSCPLVTARVVRMYRFFTLHYITLETIYSGLSKSNFKDHYGDAVI